VYNEFNVPLEQLDAEARVYTPSALSVFTSDYADVCKAMARRVEYDLEQLHPENQQRIVNLCYHYTKDIYETKKMPSPTSYSTQAMFDKQNIMNKPFPPRDLFVAVAMDMAIYHSVELTMEMFISVLHSRRMAFIVPCGTTPEMEYFMPTVDSPYAKELQVPDEFFQYYCVHPLSGVVTKDNIGYGLEVKDARAHRRIAAHCKNYDVMELNIFYDTLEATKSYDKAFIASLAEQGTVEGTTNNNSSSSSSQGEAKAKPKPKAKAKAKPKPKTKTKTKTKTKGKTKAKHSKDPKSEDEDEDEEFTA
jgi:hypothetical protein